MVLRVLILEVRMIKPEKTKSKEIILKKINPRGINPRGVKPRGMSLNEPCRNVRQGRQSIVINASVMNNGRHNRVVYRNTLKRGQGRSPDNTPIRISTLIMLNGVTPETIVTTDRKRMNKIREHGVPDQISAVVIRNLPEMINMLIIDILIIGATIIDAIVAMCTEKMETARHDITHEHQSIISHLGVQIDDHKLKPGQHQLKHGASEIAEKICLIEMKPWPGTSVPVPLRIDLPRETLIMNRLKTKPECLRSLRITGCRDL